MPFSRLNPDNDVAYRAGIEASQLRFLPESAISELLADSSRLDIPAGTTVHREGATAAHVEIVVSGLIRVFVQSPDGRTMTIRYCRSGALMGVVSLFAPSFSLPVTTQAVTDTELLVMRASVVKRMAERDVRIANVLLRELSERVVAFVGEIPGSAFSTIRQRVARHLLDLATESQDGSALVADIDQQDLADAVGTLREVVVRALRELRERDLLRTERHGIVILDAERLAVEAGGNISSRSVE